MSCSLRILVDIVVSMIVRLGRLRKLTFGFEVLIRRKMHEKGLVFDAEKIEYEDYPPQVLTHQ